MKLLKFYSPSCAPCRVLAPMVDRAAVELQLGVEGIDVTQEPELAVQFDVRAVPTLVLVGDDSDYITSKVGIMTESSLFEWLEEYL